MCNLSPPELNLNTLIAIQTRSVESSLYMLASARRRVVTYHNMKERSDYIKKHISKDKFR